ncbi:hypothetical protein HDV05_006146 [Chytridiales sp. JEL 0842]|nr:hypothetical protein HDV05_006146 [Chytridiales sp. JEL 0842]
MAEQQEEIARININALVGQTDLTHLDPALYAHDDEAIIANLRDRFAQDIMYTRVGHSSLIAVNPFKTLPGGGARSSAYELDAISDGDASPHPYEIAAAAYLHMVRATEDQAILTSGESGSGKSEVLRQVLQHIVHLSTQTDDQTNIHREVLNGDIVLECFGNAQTVQNRNSTRYSRYTELKFNEDGTIVGQKLVEYLFEHTRVSQCPENESNFHIFYILLGSLKKEDKVKWSLQNDPRVYNFLNNGKGPAFNKADLPSMQTLRACMKTLGLTKKVQNDIFQVLAGILHLGNIEFTEMSSRKGDGAYVKNRSVLAHAANLFGVGEDALETALTTATFLSGDVVCSTFLTIQQSQEARNSLAAILYQVLFRWIIEQINVKLGDHRLGSDDFVSQISLLDVAGFEDRTPKDNGFDQFCSNYANEKLHTFVLQRAINTTPDALVADGIELSIRPPPPVDIGRITLFEEPRVGIFDIIDLETNRSSESGKEATILAKLQDYNSDKTSFYEPGPEGWSTFKIKHYTGKSVPYNVNGFITKNRNSVYADVLNLFGVNQKSSSGKSKNFIANLFTESIMDLVCHPKNENAIVGARPAAPARPSQMADRAGAINKKKSTMLLSSPCLASPSAAYLQSVAALNSGEATATPTAAGAPTPQSQTAGTPLNNADKYAMAASHRSLAPASSNNMTTTLSQLRVSLDHLLEAMNGMRAWTILCIRPNGELLPNKFDDRIVRDQLQAMRVREMVSAGRFEFTVGIEFPDFLETFVDAIEDKQSVAPSKKSKRASAVSKATDASKEDKDEDEDDDEEEEEVDDDEQSLALGLSDRQRCERFINKQGWPEGFALCGDTRVFMTEKCYRQAESKLDKIQGADSEHRRIHIPAGEVGRATLKKSEMSLANTVGGKTPGSKIGLTVDTQLKGDDLEKGQVGLDIKQAGGKDDQKEDDEDEDGKKKAKRGCCGGFFATEKKEKGPPVKMSSSRRCWVNYTNFITFMIPEWCLIRVGKMKSENVRFAWREKVALCWIVAMLSGVMLFFVQGFGKLLCPVQNFFTAEEISRQNGQSGQASFVAINGLVYDITSYRHPGSGILMGAGNDLSPYFPRIDMTTGQPLVSACDFITVDPNVQFPFRTPSPFGRRNGLENATNQLCSIGLKDTLGYCHDTFLIQELIKQQRINIFQVGRKAYSVQDARSHFKNDDAWITINDAVYNMTLLYMPDSPYIIDPAVFNVNILGLAGGDASRVAASIPPKVMTCFNNLFLVGFIDRRASAAGCNASAYILYGATGIMVAVMVVKFLAALQLAPTSNPEKNDRFVIMQVPCYNEGEASLLKTIESLATLEYDDTRKLLFIVSDGMIKSAGSDITTPDIVLKILGVDKNIQQPEAKSYLAIGRGLKEHNKAKVYSGLYSIQARYIPFIFVMKCGKEGETEKPGNRGKRDSQMILMKFLNRVNFGTPMTPLELELYHHIKNIIGVDPFLYEYCLMVDADTKVEAQSLNRLISCMVHDANTMGICGETQIENEKESWVTMMQVYEYYISHHMAKAFESLFGSVTCLPGCFCMYRLRTPKKVPLLIANQILEEYKDIKVDTLHKQNLLSLGEDRFLTTLMLKHFPEYRNKFTPDAVCYTIVPDDFNMLLGQRRRWINSTVHNLFELLSLPTLCGCLCFSMRLVVFLDLFATLIMPASTAYLGYLIYASVQAQEAPIISLIMMSVAYGLQMFIFIVKNQYQHIGWMIISILAMPFFSFYIPLYAYWHFDDFKWGNTRKGSSAEKEKGGAHGFDAELEPFDAKTIPQITWEEHEAYLKKQAMENSRLEKAPSLESTAVSSSTPMSVQGDSIYSGSQYNYPRGQSAQTKRSTPHGYAPSEPEYGSGSQRNSVARYRGSTQQRNEVVDRWVTQSTEQPELGAWKGGYPADEDILRYIKYIISTSDLRELSKRKVRDGANSYFGVDLSEKKAFINANIELIIQGRCSSNAKYPWPRADWGPSRTSTPTNINMSQTASFGPCDSPKSRSSVGLSSGLPAAPTFDGSILKFLEEHDLFKNLDHEFLTTLSNSMQSRIYSPREFVIRKGEIGRAMFFVLRGEVEVISEDGETVINVMKEQSFFGEIGVLFSVPRTASCRARGRCLILALTKEKLQSILQGYPKVAETISMIAEERFLMHMKQKEEDMKVDFAEELKLGMTNKDLKKPVQFMRNEVIIRKGDIAHELFFVVGGIAEVFSEEDGRVFAQFHPGSFFGEVGLFFQIKRTASVRCTSDVITVFKLSKEDLDEVLKQYPEINNKIQEEASQRFEYNRLREMAKLSNKQEMVTDVEVVREKLKSVPLFSGTSVDFLHQLALSLKLKVYQSGETIISKGEPGNSMFFVVDGVAKVISEDGSNIYGEFTANTFFGEVALFFEINRTATVRSDSVCTVFELHKHVLKDLLSQHPDLRDKMAAKAEENYRLSQEREKTLRQMNVQNIQEYDVEAVVQRLRQVPSFKSCSTNFLRSLATLTKIEVYKQGDKIVNYGEDSSAMYFVVHGSVEIVSEDSSKVFDKVTDGGFFGEVGVLRGIKRTASVRVESEHCETIILEQNAIETVLQQYPDVYHLVALEADQRYRLIMARQASAAEVALSGQKEQVKEKVAEKPQEPVYNPRSPRRILAFGRSKPKEETSSQTGDKAEGDKKDKPRRSNSFSQLFKRKTSTSVASSLGEPPAETSNVAVDQKSDESSPAKLNKRTSDLHAGGEEQSGKDAEAGTLGGPQRRTSGKDLLQSAAETVEKQSGKLGRMFSSIRSSLTRKEERNKVAPAPSRGEKSGGKRSTASSYRQSSYSNIKVNNITELPDVDLAHIMSFLDPKERFKMRQVCRIWRDTLVEPKFWTINDCHTIFTSLDASCLGKVCQLSGDKMSVLNLQSCWQIQDDEVGCLVNACPNLTVLSVSNCWKITDRGLSYMAIGLPKMKALDLSYCGQLTGAGFHEHRWAGLVALNLTYCKQVGDEQLEKILSRTTDIQDLKLRRCVRLTDFGLFLIVRYCRLLASLDLSDCEQISDKCLKWIAASCYNLVHLHLSFCTRVTNAGLYDLSLGCQTFTTLDLSYCAQLTDAAIVFFSDSIRYLRTLKLRKCRKITDAASTYLSRTATHLRVLDLTGCPQVSVASRYVMVAINPHVQVLIDSSRESRGIYSPEEIGKKRATEVPLHVLFTSGPREKIKEAVISEIERGSEKAGGSGEAMRKRRSSHGSDSKKKGGEGSSSSSSVAKSGGSSAAASATSSPKTSTKGKASSSSSPSSGERRKSKAVAVE